MANKTKASAGLNQVIAVLSITAQGALTLIKDVRTHMGAAAGEPVMLHRGAELRLSKQGLEGIPLDMDKRGKIQLPQTALDQLQRAGSTPVAVITRADGVAIKPVRTVEEQGPTAKLIEIETPDYLERRAVINPPPETALPQLNAQYTEQGLRLAHPVESFVRGRSSLETWLSRRLWTWTDRGDAALQDALIQQRREAQQSNGSWKDDLLLTARQLYELGELGLDGTNAVVTRGIDWLVERPQSPYNPGMWFATDTLVEAQLAVIAQKERGEGGRFRKIKTSEKKRIMSGDDVISAPCGPRIMWPTALVLQALLLLGGENLPRVQQALTFMRTRDWCECSYQHGSFSWRKVEAQNESRLSEMETQCKSQYRYGGLPSLEAFLYADQRRTTRTLPRTTRRTTDQGKVYSLEMPDHVQGCEFITTRAMSKVQEPLMRRFAEAHLWRFAGQQRENGAFAPDRYGAGLTWEGVLEAFAAYDHPASNMVIMRALPLLIEQQHDDGSWGDTSHRERMTLAVLRALHRVRDLLPDGFVR